MRSDDRSDSDAGSQAGSRARSRGTRSRDGARGGSRSDASGSRGRDGARGGGGSRGGGSRGGGDAGGGPPAFPSFDMGAIQPGGGVPGEAFVAQPTHRLAQVNSLITRVLRDRLARGLNDPRVQGMVSVLGVTCTPDFANAHVRISVLPGEKARLTLSGIRSATRHLEGIIRKATRLRKVPRLLFDLDDSIKREAALTASLREATLGRNGPDGAEPDEGTEARDAAADTPQDHDAA